MHPSLGPYSFKATKKPPIGPNRWWPGAFLFAVHELPATSGKILASVQSACQEIDVIRQPGRFRESGDMGAACPQSRKPAVDRSDPTIYASQQQVERFWLLLQVTEPVIGAGAIPCQPSGIYSHHARQEAPPWCIH